MILRTYRARPRPDRIKAYEFFESTKGIDVVASVPGCLGVGFGRIRESPEPTYLFFSIWQDQRAFEAGKTDPGWGKAKAELGNLDFTLPGDVVEHVDLTALRIKAAQQAVHRPSLR